MSDAIQFHSRVGNDGVLNVSINLGKSEATKEVVVTIQSIHPRETLQSGEASWKDFVNETYGSCAGLGLERHDQGRYEDREPLE